MVSFIPKLLFGNEGNRTQDTHRPTHFDCKLNSALLGPLAVTSKVNLLSVLYLAGTLSPRGQPPRGGRSSPSPICGSRAEIRTRCVATKAPFSPVLATRLYSPSSLVL